MRAGAGTIRADQDFIMTCNPLADFEIQKYIKMSLNIMVLIQEIIYLK